MNKIKVAVVGAGYMATEHAKAFASINEFIIVGICTRTTNKAIDLADKYHARVYENIDEMYAQTKAELVIVAVNEMSMLDVCKQVFKYPWLCFLEKPVGYHYDQALEISQLAYLHDQQPYVALYRRSYSSTRSALAHLSREGCGARLVSILDQQDINAALDMGQPELVASNYMFANSIHLIDYFNLFCRGDIISVEPTVPWDQDKPEYVIATLKYSSNDVGIYQAIWNGPGPWSVSVSNASYRLEMRPLEALKIQKKGERTMSDAPLAPEDLAYKPGLYYQALQILNYFKGQLVNLATLSDSLKSMKLCAMIYEK